MGLEQSCRKMKHCRLNASMDYFNTKARAGFLLFILLLYVLQTLVHTQTEMCKSQNICRKLTLCRLLFSRQVSTSFFTQNSVSEGCQDEEMVSSFPEH